MIGDDGCEPYSMDFGDREYVAWLEKWLTPDELAERWRRWAWHARLWPLPHGASRWAWWRHDMRRRLLWPLIKFVDWRVVRIDRLAEKRGGAAPGPSWKVRTEFGEPR